MRSSAVQCNVVLCNAVSCSIMQLIEGCSKGQYDAVEEGQIKSNQIQLGKVKSG